MCTKGFERVSDNTRAYADFIHQHEQRSCRLEPAYIRILGGHSRTHCLHSLLQHLRHLVPGVLRRSAANIMSPSGVSDTGPPPLQDMSSVVDKPEVNGLNMGGKHEAEMAAADCVDCLSSSIFGGCFGFFTECCSDASQIFNECCGVCVCLTCCDGGGCDGCYCTDCQCDGVDCAGCCM